MFCAVWRNSALTADRQIDINQLINQLIIESIKRSKWIPISFHFTKKNWGKICFIRQKNEKNIASPSRNVTKIVPFFEVKNEKRINRRIDQTIEMNSYFILRKKNRGRILCFIPSKNVEKYRFIIKQCQKNRSLEFWKNRQNSKVSSEECLEENW